MKNKTTTNPLSNFPSQISHILHRYHVVIFTLTVIGGLALAIFFLNLTLNQSTLADEAGGVNTTFDTETINRINQLQTREDANRELTFPEGRINPFVE